MAHTLALIGATGGIGQHVLRKALAQGHTVRALARDPSKVPPAPHLTLVKGDVRTPSSLDTLLTGCDTVLSCLGTRRTEPVVTESGTRAILEAMKRQGVGRIAVVSAIGVGDSAPQLPKLSRVFAYVIKPLLLSRQYADLERMEQVVRDSEVPSVLVRPAGLSNGTGAGRWRAGGPHDTVGSMIPREDVAAYLLSLLDQPGWDGRAVSLGGP